MNYINNYRFSVHVSYWKHGVSRKGIICREISLLGSVTHPVCYLPSNWLQP